jgi:hypothetical protein
MNRTCVTSPQPACTGAGSLLWHTSIRGAPMTPCSPCAELEHPRARVPPNAPVSPHSPIAPTPPSCAPSTHRNPNALSPPPNRSQPTFARVPGPPSSALPTQPKPTACPTHHPVLPHPTRFPTPYPPCAPSLKQSLSTTPTFLSSPCAPPANPSTDLIISVTAATSVVA